MPPSATSTLPDASTTRREHRPSADDVLPFAAVEATLANGLVAIVVPTGFPEIVSLQIAVQTGSRNEVEPGKSGFAHFFEHMMFRGTRTYSPERYQGVLTEIGARGNAYTTDDYTNYHTTFSRDDLETVLALEADRFQHLEYAEEAFRTEARAVLGEYNKNSANPLEKLIEAQQNAAYTVHTYKHTTMGFLEDIEAMPTQFDYSRLFFDRWYRPEYTALIVAGDVDVNRTLALLDKHWGSWQRGGFRLDIPQEPPPRGPVYAHVPWDTPTLPWVAVSFHGPAFSASSPVYAATELLVDLAFGSASDLYRALVQEEQTVDQMFAVTPGTIDPGLVTVAARLKNEADAPMVRDRILGTAARVRHDPPAGRRLNDAIANARYAFARSLDNTETIAETLARFVRYHRSYDTVNELYRTLSRVSAADVRTAAESLFRDSALVVTTLSHGELHGAIAAPPALESLAPSEAFGTRRPTIIQRSSLPQLTVKIAFEAGSAYDPPGRRGLAAMTASMLADASSSERSLDEITRALYPIAGSIEGQVDKEMVTFTLGVHRDNWEALFDLVLPMLLSPALRESDFDRVRDTQRNALVQDLCANNDEELGKERLQSNIFSGTPYAHPALGTVAGIDAITLDDVRDFARRGFTQRAMFVGVAGDAPTALLDRLERGVSGFPDGAPLTLPAFEGRRSNGLEVEIVEKDTRATAISFGLPIAVTRSHPDFAALHLARTWLGEHRSSVSHLYQRLREIRGLNYGDYAYIEAFPRGMFQFFPDPNVVRRKQLFEVWLRPVLPPNAPMALRLALHELSMLIEQGMSAEVFERTRRYLMKSVFLMTATQGQQLGYAIDSAWYGTGEYTSWMRERLSELTHDKVNAAIVRHLSARDLSVVMVARDAAWLREQLVTDSAPEIAYDSPPEANVLAEDELVRSRKLGITPEQVRITPVDQVFAD